MSTPQPAFTMAERPARERVRPSVGQIFRDALWLGAIGFGGGFSVLGSIRALAVERRRWLTEREFANTATVAQMLPGGAAANALGYVGLRFRGPAGAVAAYVGFVLPGFALTLALAAAYVEFGAAPRAEAVLGGLSAAVVGIVASLTIQLVRTSVARGWQMGIAASALLLSLPGGASAGEIALLAIGAGLVVDLGTKQARLLRLKRHRGPDAALPYGGGPLRTPAPRSAPAPRGAPDETLRAGGALLLFSAAVLHVLGLDAELLRLTLVFLRTGLGAYGGGLAVIPHLKSAVEAHAWLTDRQFADAVAIGKLTPGPVLLMGTFIGYLVGGLPGSLLATVGVLAAPLGLVIALGTFLDRVRSRRPVRAALRGLTPAVAGLMGAATLSLGTTLDGGVELAIAAAVALTLQRFPANPALMLALGGAARFALHAAGV
jgi:chromate transporter